MIDHRRGFIVSQAFASDRSRKSYRRKASVPVLERLDDRLVLSGLASTTVAGSSVGQTLSNVINNTSLGGLTVDSTTDFLTASPPNFLLLSPQAGQSPFALVSYIGLDGTTESFTTLAMPAGDGTFAMSSSTVVEQAPRGTTAAGAGQPLSASPFSLTMSGPATGFASSGYIYVQASRGTYIMNYTGLTAVSGNAQFTGCTIVGAFGSITGSPFTDTVNAGSFIVQSVAPPPRQTTSLNPSEIVVTAGTPFQLPVISTAGFAPATPSHPKFALVYYSTGTLALVSYTGITADTTNGGSILTGCTTTTSGTIGAYGATSGPSANVQWTSAEPIDFAFTNDSGQTPVYVAIAGQQIDPTTNVTTYGYLAPQSTGGSLDFSKTWQFQAFAGQSNVPAYQIFSSSSSVGDQQSVLVPNNPYARLDSVRMIFSVGSPPTIPITGGRPNFPAAGNPTDPNNSITYDFVEFTERSSPNDGILFINSTQVDQVGIPFTMQTTPADSVKANGVGITVSRSQMYYDYGQFVQTQFGPLTGSAAANAAAAFDSLTTTNRLLNPSDAISNPPDASVSGAFNTYFDAALTKFFSSYIGSGNTFRFQRDGYYFSGQTVTGYNPAPYSATATNNGTALLIPPNGSSPTSLKLAVGQPVSGPGVPTGATITSVSVDSSNVTTVGYAPAGAAQSGSATYTFAVPGDFTVLQLKQTDSTWTEIAGGQQYQIYAPYFSNGTPYPAGFPASSATPPAAPPWISPSSAGLMVFGNLGAFADGGAQQAMGQISGSGASGQTLLDIENSIVSAFNRGIANAVAPGSDVTSAWNDNATFYPTPSQDGSNWSNVYAGFLHNDNVSVTAPGSTVGLAYGFAYDDQGGNDPTLTSFALRVAITLGTWTDTTALGIKPTELTTVVGSPTQIVVTAYKDKGKSEIDTTYLGRIVFSADDIAAGLPAFYQFTPDDKGTKTFAFTPKTAGTLAVSVSDPANRIASTTATYMVEPSGIAFAVGADSGAEPIVKIYDGNSVEQYEIMAYERSFRGGVRVAVGDVNGDGLDDIVTAPGAGFPAVVKVFDGRTGALISQQAPFGDRFMGGAYVAAGDLDGDGISEIIVGSGAGGPTRIFVLDGRTGQPIVQRLAFHAGFAGGATVAAADLNGDGRAEIIAGSGPGGGSKVRVFDGRTLHVKSDFRAFSAGFGGQVFVSAGDVLGDSQAEIIAGASPTGRANGLGAAVRLFSGRGKLLSSFRSNVRSNGQGPRVSTFASDASPKLSVLVNAGPGHAAVDIYRVVDVSPYPRRPNYKATLTESIVPLGADHTFGYFLGGGGDRPIG